MSETEAGQNELGSAPVAECSRCGKPETLCVCKDITPIDNKITLLILQHPQEQDKALRAFRDEVKPLIMKENAAKLLRLRS